MKSGRFATSMRTRPQRQKSFSIPVSYQKRPLADSSRRMSHQSRSLAIALAPPERPSQLAPASQAVRPEQDDQQHDQRQNDVADAGRRADGGLADLHADFDLAQKLSQHRDHERAGDGTGETAAAADDQHRHDQEGEIEIEIFDAHDPEKMRQQNAGDAGQERRDDERNQTMANNIDAGSLRGGLVLARSPQLQGGARLLISKRDDDGGHG